MFSHAKRRGLVGVGVIAALLGLLVVATAPADDEPAPLSLCAKKLNGQLRMSSTCDDNEIRVVAATTDITATIQIVMREQYLEQQENLKALAEKIELSNQEKAELARQLAATQLRLGDVELIVARVDNDDDGFPDIDDVCPTDWGIPPLGCPIP